MKTHRSLSRHKETLVRNFCVKYTRIEGASDRTREQYSLVKVFGRMKYFPANLENLSAENPPYTWSKNREE